MLASEVTKCALLARVWERRGIGTDCPEIYILPPQDLINILFN